MELREECVVFKRVDEGNGMIFESKSDQQKQVCDVCGYANEKGAALCKMCSNYLYTTGGVQNVQKQGK